MSLTIDLTPGKQFAAGEKANRDALNLLGQGSIVLDGAVDSAQIDAEAVNTTHLAVHAYFYGEEAAGSETIVVTLTPPLRTLEAGALISFKAASTKNSANPITLNVDGLGAKPVLKRGGVSLRTGDIKNGQTALVQYVISALYNAGAGAWVLLSLEGNEVENYIVSAGSNVAYTAAYVPALLSLYTGLRVAFRCHTDCGAGATFDPNSLGAKPILKFDANALEANDILQDQMVELFYDAAIGASGAWLLNSPLRINVFGQVFAQGTPTGTVLAGTDTAMGSISMALPAGKTWNTLRIAFATVLKAANPKITSLRNMSCKVGADLLTLVNTAPPVTVPIANSDDVIQMAVQFEGPVHASHLTDNPLIVTVYGQTADLPDETNQRVLYGVGVYL